MGNGQKVAARRKVQVPAEGPAVLTRGRLDARLADVERRRVTLVTAGPGLGKTSLLAGWARRTGCSWYSVGPEDKDPAVLAKGLLEAARTLHPELDPDAVVASPRGDDLAIASEGQESVVADQLIRTFTEGLDTDVTIVLDDVHELAGSDLSSRLLGELVRGGPPRLHLVLSSRLDAPFGVARLQAQGLAGDVPGSALRFTAEETAAVTATILGPDAAAVAAALHEQTAGWPAAVRIVAEWLRPMPVDQWPALVAKAGDPGGPLESYLLEEVLPTTPGPVLDLLAAVAAVPRFTPPLAAELVGAGVEELIGRLAGDGPWIVPDEAHPGWHVVTPVVCRLIGSHVAVGGDTSTVVVRRAAAWMEGRGETGPAFAALLESPEPDAADDTACARAGALLIRGDLDEALALVEPWVPAEGPVPMSAGLVAALVHHYRIDLDAALALYERALAGPGPDALRAMVLGWAAAAAWMRGDVERSRRMTNESEQAAVRSGDDRALAMAFTARGMLAAIDGDRRAMHHYGRALAHAEAAHDHLQIVRIRANRGNRFLSEGYYREAVGELDEAVRLADLAGIAFWGALASLNRGEALLGLGRLDEAVADLVAARAGYERVGSSMAGYALTHMGYIHRLQGHSTLARSHFEDSLAIAERSNDNQGRVWALAGLAMMLADTDPEEAIRLTHRAVALASLAKPRALIAAARAALRTGDVEVAASQADDACVTARTLHDRPALAEALELKARAVGGADAAELLEEAATLWAAVGSPLGRARVLLAEARLAGPNGQADAARAEQVLRRLGARALASEAAKVQAELARAALPALSVRVLGGFGVERGGIPVLTTEWQSRKARDLLKVLIARRGHPVARDVLLDLLWADEDPAKAASRLSVTLSTLRAVLDPEKKFDPEHFVANDRTAAWLRLEHMSVDVEAFLADAAAGLRALAQDDIITAGRLLTSAEAAYAGDFLEEDLYEDWSVILREEARSTYVSVAMGLAELAVAAGDHDAAVRYLLRVLARDSYDERAHLLLITALTGAGRHGEARRMYRAYCGRMAEIDVEPAAFPDAGRKR